MSTGPGRHDFEIVVDPAATVEEDLARRDFTINAMARRLADGALVDPFGGRDDLEQRVLRTVSPSSFAEDPLRLVRGLRFVSQLDLDPDVETLRQMREEADAVRLVSGERIGGGLAADGMGELSKLLLGARPRRRCGSRATRACSSRCCPSSSRRSASTRRAAYHGLTVDEHTFAVVQAAADAGVPLRVRLAALFHDLGKPVVAWRGRDGRLHYYARPGNRSAPTSRSAPSWPPWRCRDSATRPSCDGVSSGSCAATCSTPRGDAARARRLLARYGDELTFDLLDHKEADLRGKWGPERAPPSAELSELADFRRWSRASSRARTGCATSRSTATT